MSEKQFNIGSKVKWKWGNGWGQGKIKEKYTKKTTKKINGTDVTREASNDEPAYLIEQRDGDIVLKSHTEIELD